MADITDENIILVNEILDFSGEPAMTTKEITYVNTKGLPSDTEQNRFDIAIFICTIRETMSIAYKYLSSYADIYGLIMSGEVESVTNIVIGNVIE